MTASARARRTPAPRTLFLSGLFALLSSAPHLVQAEPPPPCAATCKALYAAAAAHCATLGASVRDAMFACATDASGAGGGGGPCFRNEQAVGGFGGVVRASCAPPEPRVTWSDWLSRDDPAGEGDIELLSDFDPAKVGCDKPTLIEARSVGGTPAKSTGQVVSVHPQVGAICKHAAQRNGTSCLDYQVRFGCEQPSIDWAQLTQAWQEETTRSGGGILHFVPASIPLPKTRFRSAMTFEPGNTMQVLRLAADNAHYFVKGVWSKTGNVLAIQYSDGGETMIERYDVLELGPGVLRLKKH